MRNRKFLRSKRTPTAKSHCWADIDTERRKLGGRTWYLIRWFINFGAPLAAQVSLALHHLIFFLFFFFQNLLNFKTLSLFTTSYFIIIIFFGKSKNQLNITGRKWHVRTSMNWWWSNLVGASKVKSQPFHIRLTVTGFKSQR